MLARAIYDFEEAHVSTIHGFCAELLRERPVEARVDPAFTVLTETQADRLFDEAFTAWLHGQLGKPQAGVRRSLRRPVRWRPEQEEINGPIERQRRMVGDMVPESVYDGWEAALVGLADNRDFARPRKGSGAAFALGVTRDQALASHAQLLQALGAFRDAANADVAALLHEEMRDCLDRYERRKQRAGALDFLDLLIKARSCSR